MESHFAQGALVFAAGMGVGLFHFGGLWITVWLIARKGRSGMLSLLSFIGRTGVSLLLFYLIMDGDWRRLMIGMAGLVLARMALVRYLRPDCRASFESPLKTEKV